MSVLYHLRILPMIVRFLGRTLSKVLGTSGAESFSTAADIFVGQTEAPLTIRPYLAKATLSELHACMTAGFATTAGAVLVTYATMLKPWIDGIAGHLIACSVLCAPASLVIAKLLLPENAEPETAGRTDLELPRSSTNLIDAIAAGTTDGLRLAVNVAGMLIVFIALTALLDAGLGYVWGLFQSLGGEVGGWLSREPWSLSMLFGWIFRPLAWVLGMPASDVPFAAALLGKDPTALSERGRLILSYALCGFANFGSIGIQIGGYAALEPSRRGDFAKVALRAMIGGLLTTCLVAALVGVIA
jgi:CNT family concentrative nucleoside transporter